MHVYLHQVEDNLIDLSLCLNIYSLIMIIKETGVWSNDFHLVFEGILPILI